MKEFSIISKIKEYASAVELPDEIQALLQAAKDAMETSWAPYSQFNVGAAVLIEDGNIISGSNQENAAYPSGLCAERVAFFNAAVHAPGKKIKAVAVTTSYDLPQPVAPCGACRQVMLEYELKQNAPIPIFLTHPKGTIYEIASVQELLPLNFSGEWLRK